MPPGDNCCFLVLMDDKGLLPLPLPDFFILLLPLLWLLEEAENMSPWDLAPRLDPGYNFIPVAGRVSVRKFADMPPNVCFSFFGFGCVCCCCCWLCCGRCGCCCGLGVT